MTSAQGAGEQGAGEQGARTAGEHGSGCPDATPELTVEALAGSLIGLPGVGPSRCRGLLRVLLADLSPSDAWKALLSDRFGSQIAAELGEGPWLEVARRAARSVDPAALARRCLHQSIGVLVAGRPDFPEGFESDPSGPAVVFYRGDPSNLGARPRVAVVGTRNPTGCGCDVARELARGLAEAGVVVVSGMAIGIDGAAHEGALAAGEPGLPSPRASGSSAPHEGEAAAAPTIAVLAGGADVVYPRRHRSLYERIVASGIVISEAAPGVIPEAWRFPVRNRLMAILADVVVVVESADRGGSMWTVDAAMNRGVPVMAVPGSVRNPSSRGTNTLIAEGCAPCRDVEDVLVALSLVNRHVSEAPVLATRAAGPADPRGATPRARVRGRRAARPAREPELCEEDRAVLASVAWEPTTTGVVARGCRMDVGTLLVALDRLEERGLVRHGPGWWERAR